MKGVAPFLILSLLLGGGQFVFAHSVEAQSAYTQSLAHAKAELSASKIEAQKELSTALKKAKGDVKKKKRAQSLYASRIAKANAAYKAAVKKAGATYDRLENAAHAQEKTARVSKPNAKPVSKPVAAPTPAVSSEQKAPQQPPPEQQSQPAPVLPEQAIPAKADTPASVSYTNIGFSPRIITVKAGTQVIFANQSDETLWVGSDPHPIHTDLSGFDSLQGFQKGESYSHTFSKPGRWGYHNHVSPLRDGFVVVTE